MGLVSATTLALALAAHTLAGGLAPSVAALLWAAVGCLVLSTVVVARDFSVARVLAVLGLAQVGLHELFRARAGGVDRDPLAGGAHHHPPLEAVLDQPTGALSRAMVLTHLAATVLVAVLVVRVERVLWHVSVALGCARLPATKAPTCIGGPPPVRQDAPVVKAISGRSSISRRGPPLLVAPHHS